MSRTLYELRTSGRVAILELTLPEHTDPTDMDRLNALLLSLVADQNASGWAVDLARCDYIGSALLGSLINLRHAVRSRNQPIVLCGLSESLLDVFRTSALERLFMVVATQDEAVRQLGG